MATAILHSIKIGAYSALVVYVAFIAVITVASMNSQMTAQVSMPSHSSVDKLVSTKGGGL